MSSSSSKSKAKNLPKKHKSKSDSLRTSRATSVTSGLPPLIISSQSVRTASFTSSKSGTKTKTHVHDKANTNEDEKLESEGSMNGSRPFKRIMLMRYSRPKMPWDNGCWGQMTAPAYCTVGLPCGYSKNPFLYGHPGEFPISNRAILIRPQQKNMQSLLARNQGLKIANHLKTVDICASFVNIKDHCEIPCGICPNVTVAPISPPIQSKSIVNSSKKQKQRKSEHCKKRSTKQSKSCKESSTKQSKNSKRSSSKQRIVP